MALEKHFDLIFRTEDGLMTLLPRTVAEQVYMVDGHPVADHIHSDKHLLPTERFAFDRINQAGGFLVLDANGYVPLGFIDKSMIAIQTEFADIDDMLTNGATTAQGYLVWVVDASADPAVKGQHTWAIYRRNNNPDPSTLDGWTCLTAGLTLDINLNWDAIPGKPDSSPSDIDAMVQDAHEHTNKNTIDEIFGTNEKVSYKGRSVAYDADVARFYDEDQYDNNLRVGDFWLKSSYSQSWWYDTTIENAGVSCYEKYRDFDSMVTSPKVRTHNTTDMTRMFYGDTALEEVQQYKVNNVKTFTQMFAGCTSLEYVPTMGTYAGEVFDQMFDGCVKLKTSPEMVLNNAKSVNKMFNGCVSLEYVLPFGSTEKVTNFREMFAGCESLKKIYPAIDFSSATNVVGMFNGCIDLEEVAFVPGTLKTSLSLADTNLTLESMLDIINGLPTVTNNPTLTLTGIPAVGEIPESITNTARLKGWTIVPSREPQPGAGVSYAASDLDNLAFIMDNSTTDDEIVISETIPATDGNPIPISKEVSLTLESNIISSSNSNSGLVVGNNGKLELAGDGLLVTTQPYDKTHSSGVLNVSGDGEVVFNGSGISAVVESDPVNKGQFGVCSYDDAKVTINDGQFTAGWYCLSGNGAKTSADAVTTINGGVFESVSDYAIYHPHAGKLVINGGDISGAAGALAANNGTIIITGGTLVATGGGDTGDAGDGTGGLGNAVINLNARYGDITCEISGGTFIATGDDTILIATGTKHNVNLIITGGKFSSKPNSAWIPEGWLCTNEPDEEGLYEVYKALG